MNNEISNKEEKRTNTHDTLVLCASCFTIEGERKHTQRFSRLTPHNSYRKKENTHTIKKGGEYTYI